MMRHQVRRGIRNSGMLAAAAGLLALVSSPPHSHGQTSSWKVNGSGNWNNAANWDPNTGFPNAVDAVALVTNNIAANATLTLGQSITVGTLVLADANGGQQFQVQPGGGTLIFQTTSGDALLRLRPAASFVQAPIVVNSKLIVDDNTGNQIIKGNITLNAPIEFRVQATQNGDHIANNVTISGPGDLRIFLPGFLQTDFPQNNAHTGGTVLGGSTGNGIYVYGSTTANPPQGVFPNTSSFRLTSGLFILGDQANANSLANNNNVFNRIKPTLALNLGATLDHDYPVGVFGATFLLSSPQTGFTHEQNFASLNLDIGRHTIASQNLVGGAVMNLKFTGTGGSGYTRGPGGAVNFADTATEFHPSFVNAPTAAGGSAVKGTGSDAILVGATLNGTNFVRAQAGDVSAAGATVTNNLGIWGSAGYDGNILLQAQPFNTAAGTINSLIVNWGGGGADVPADPDNIQIAAGQTLNIASGNLMFRQITGIIGGYLTSGNGRDLVILGSVRGDISSSITGNIDVVYANTANDTTLRGDNFYTGKTYVTGGRLQLRDQGVAGVPPIPGDVVIAGLNATLLAGNGNTIADNGLVTILGTGGFFSIGSGNETIGGLASKSGGEMQLSANRLSLNGSQNTLFDGVISGTGGITRQGTGSIRLTGANTYTGTTIVNGGTLQVDGSIVSPTTVNAAGTLAGRGSVNANVAVYGGTVSPASGLNSVGTLNITGNLDLWGHYDVDINHQPVTPTADKIVVGGTIGLTNDTLYDGSRLYLNTAGGTPRATDATLVILDAVNVADYAQRFYDGDSSAVLEHGDLVQTVNSPIGTTNDTWIIRYWTVDPASGHKLVTLHKPECAETVDPVTQSHIARPPAVDTCGSLVAAMIKRYDAGVPVIEANTLGGATGFFTESSFTVPAGGCALGVSYNPKAPNEVTPVGLYNVVATGVNVDGFATCELPVKIVDETKPTVQCMDITRDIPADSSDLVVQASEIDNGSTDVVSGTTLTPKISLDGATWLDSLVFSKDDLCAVLGQQLTVYLEVTDAAGNSDTCEAKITILDGNSVCNQAPVCENAVIGGDNVVSANPSAPCGATISGADVTEITDADGDELLITVQPTDLVLGANQVTVTANDGKGGICTKVVTVQVVDGTAPYLNCPLEVVQDTDADLCGATVTYSVEASDNCSVPAVECSVASGSFFGVGTNTVNCTATDGASLTASCSFQVIVNDTQAPSLTVPADATIECPADTSVSALGSATAEDACGVASVVSADTVVEECGNTKTITRRWTATDVNGTSTSADQVIRVVDTTAPSITAPADLTVATGAVPAATFAGGVANDTCGNVNVTHEGDVILGGCGGNQVITRTYKATDDCGNSATAVQTITVVGLFQSGGDAISWLNPLARNGYSVDPAPALGGAQLFKAGSTIPVKIVVNGCAGDVTANANVTAQVAVYQDLNCTGLATATEEAIDFTGVGGSGGLMDLVIGSDGKPHRQYNLSTKRWAVANKCYVIVVTVTDTSTGETRTENVPIKARK